MIIVSIICPGGFRPQVVGLPESGSPSFRNDVQHACEIDSIRVFVAGENGSSMNMVAERVEPAHQTQV